MVDVNIKFPTPAQRYRSRLERVRRNRPPPGIRVEPKNEDIRRVLKHPRGMIAFRSEGSIEWPNDTFTHRRIRDGDVTVVNTEEKKEKAPAARGRQQPPPNDAA